MSGLAVSDGPTKRVSLECAERARELVLQATATDLLSGNRPARKEDRATVYRWLCDAAAYLIPDEGADGT